MRVKQEWVDIERGMVVGDTKDTPLIVLVALSSNQPSTIHCHYFLINFLDLRHVTSYMLI